MPKKYDMREVLYWIRRGARYEWLELGSNNYESIGQWYGPGEKPTEQEILDAWNAYAAAHADEWAFETAREQAEISALSAYPNLPDWVKTVTPDDASQYIHDNVMNGLDQAGVNTYIDNQFSSVTNLATALPVIVSMFKLIGGQLIMFRDLIGFVIKLIMYMRDLVIKYRQSQ